MTTAPLRPASRPFPVTVAAVTRLSPSFVRVTFRDEGLADFADDGLDQRIKVVLPDPEHGFAHFPFEGEWYSAWRSLPDGQRNVFRTYTARAIRPDRGEIDVDFVCHGDAGPASAWVERACVGDALVIIGPDARSGQRRVGVEWEPSGAASVLLAGDETAVPAVSAILEALPATSRGQVFLEVASSSDILPISSPAGVDVCWLTRRDEAGAVTRPSGERLVAAVREWAGRRPVRAQDGVPCEAHDLTDVDVDREILWEVSTRTSASADLYAWLAGEAQSIKTLRRLLVGEFGLPRSQVAFMGYWRLGKSEN